MGGLAGLDFPVLAAWDEFIWVWELSRKASLDFMLPPPALRLRATRLTLATFYHDFCACD